MDQIDLDHIKAQMTDNIVILLDVFAFSKIDPFSREKFQVWEVYSRTEERAWPPQVIVIYTLLLVLIRTFFNPQGTNTLCVFQTSVHNLTFTSLSPLIFYMLLKLAHTSCGFHT